MKILICFTASFPYSKGEETFFGKELLFLAEKFDFVYIQPLYNPSESNHKWPVPHNTTSWEPLPSKKFSLIFKAIFNLSPITLFLRDFFKFKVYLSLDKSLIWLHSFFLFRLLYVRVKGRIKQLDNVKNVTLYSYWANALIFPCSFFDRFKKVVRMHGGDYYLYRNNSYLPLRDKIYASADLLVPISTNISDDLRGSYKIEANKIYLGRMGISNDSNSCIIRNNETIKVVSCSNLIPLKRVSIIAQALCKIQTIKKIEWHHFGEGEEYIRLQNLCKSLPDNISATFHGWVSNRSLFSFYKENYISWFINVSIYEGIPVSIMEAFSFGIPAIATDVGGTREIVNMNNGHLLSSDTNSETIASLILECTSEHYLLKRKNAYETWANHYNAEKNYKEFVNRIENL